MKKCKSGYYYCNTDKKCKPIPRGYRVGYGGYLRKEDDDDSKNKSNGNGNGNGNGSNGNGNGGNGSGGNGGGGNGGGMGEEVTHESVAAMTAGASKVIPAVVAGVGALGTIMQAKRSQDTKASRGRRSEKPKRKLSRMAQKQIEIENKRGENVTKYDPTKGMIKPKIGEVRKTEELIGKYKATNKVIKPKEGEVTKQRELLKNVEKNITKPKKGEKKDAKKTVKNFIKARKKEGDTMYKLKQDAEIADKGPGDLLPKAKKSYLEKLRRNLRKPENEFHTEDAIPTNSLGGGQIAGTVEAGDDPPVKKKKKKGKKKRYIYGGRGSRKMWMT